MTTTLHTSGENRSLRRMEKAQRSGNPALVVSEEVRSLPLLERAARTWELEDERERNRQQYRLKSAAKKYLGIGEEEITWSDSIAQALRSDPEIDFFVNPTDHQCFEWEGLLFRLDSRNTLCAVQFCAGCGVKPRLLRTDSVAALGEALLNLEVSFKCKTCKQNEAMDRYAKKRGK